jgi:hypothetical protein
MNLLKEIYHIHFKVKLVIFKLVPFAIYIHVFQRSCQLLKQLWKSSFVNALKHSFVAASISGIVSKRFRFIANLISGNSQKSQGAKSGEYGGWGHKIIFYHPKTGGWQETCDTERCHEAAQIRSSTFPAVFIACRFVGVLTDLCSIVHSGASRHELDQATPTKSTAEFFLFLWQKVWNKFRTHSSHVHIFRQYELQWANWNVKSIRYFSDR